MEVDLRTGFVKQPTFADLARLEKKPLHAKPIIRDAETYWNFFAVDLRNERLRTATRLSKIINNFAQSMARHSSYQPQRESSPGEAAICEM